MKSFILNIKTKNTRSHQIKSLIGSSFKFSESAILVEWLIIHVKMNENFWTFKMEWRGILGSTYVRLQFLLDHQDIVAWLWHWLVLLLGVRVFRVQSKFLLCPGKLTHFRHYFCPLLFIISYSAIFICEGCTVEYIFFAVNTKPGKISGREKKGDGEWKERNRKKETTGKATGVIHTCCGCCCGTKYRPFIDPITHTFRDVPALCRIGRFPDTCLSVLCLILFRSWETYNKRINYTRGLYFCLCTVVFPLPV